MPTYDYECQACNHEFEAFQSMTADPLRKCPSCGKLKLQRLIGTGAGVIFKGGGFYETDYRSESYKQAQKAESEAASGKSGDKPASSSDSKASSPAEGKPAQPGTGDKAKTTAKADAAKASHKGDGEKTSPSKAAAKSRSGSGAAGPSAKSAD